jgi:glycosyltransferase involved in cell wall biosynthesis
LEPWGINMKIALTCPASLPATQFGGILFLCLDIAKEASNKNHDVTIFTTDMDFANNPKTFNNNLPTTEKIENFIIKRSHVWFSFSLFFINPGMYFQMVRSDPDIIHSIGIRSFQSFIAALVSRKKHIPLVISDQGGLTTHPDLTSSGFFKKLMYKIQSPMIKFVINQAEKISVANEYEKNIFLNFSNESKISVVRNGINLETMKSDVNFKIKYKIEKNFILFLGRFSKIKGIDTLLSAVNLLKNDKILHNTQFVIMGVDFGFENEMLNLIKEFHIEDHVKIIKNPPRDDVLAAYKYCQFLVLPSKWELSPLTPLEGFAFKKPVISTTAHGIPYTVKHNVNGLLIEPEDVNSLSKYIIELLSNPEKCEKFGKAGHDFVNDVCNSKIMVEKTLKIYHDLVNK